MYIYISIYIYIHTQNDSSGNWELSFPYLLIDALEKERHGHGITNCNNILKRGRGLQLVNRLIQFRALYKECIQISAFSFVFGR